ncbi:MAG: hypothetical protein H6R10_1492 [Rhodocyclaceae bacterium]|nr:hypothetical protein [Rhodocyclaceae bacterium]
MLPDGDELEEARAALAPTLEATASILPWVATPKKPRFPPESAKRWQAVCDRLAVFWFGRHENGLAGLRPAVFELYGAALELGDADCLRLSEALASATDRLEIAEGVSSPRLAAALSATFESLALPDSLEHEAFPDRVRHFAGRLERCADPQGAAQVRSPVLDRLFVGEAGDGLERLHEALAVLPADVYGMRLAAEDIARLAEPLDLDDIGIVATHLARLLTPKPGEHVDLDGNETRRAAVLALVAELEKSVAVVAEG